MGNHFVPVVSCLVSRLQSLQNGLQESAADCQTPGAPDIDDTHKNVHNYQYQAGLCRQLERSVIFLLSLANTHDIQELALVDQQTLDIVVSAVINGVSPALENAADKTGVEPSHELVEVIPSVVHVLRKLLRGDLTEDLVSLASKFSCLERGSYPGQNAFLE